MKKTSFLLFIIVQSGLLQADNLLSLLNNVSNNQTVSAKSKVTPSSPMASLNTLISDLSAKQKNVAYQNALKILNETTLSTVYRQDLFTLNLFFADYTTQVLQNDGVQAAQDTKQLSLSSLLSLIKPQSAPNAVPQPANDLSNLLNILTQTPASSDVSKPKKSNTSLLNLIEQAVPSTPGQQTVKSSLLNLLHTMPAAPVAKTEKSSISLLNLLNTKE
jgi:hypothetical protein